MLQINLKSEHPSLKTLKTICKRSYRCDYITFFRGNRSHRFYIYIFVQLKNLQQLKSTAAATTISALAAFVAAAQSDRKTQTKTSIKVSSSCLLLLFFF